MQRNHHRLTSHESQERMHIPRPPNECCGLAITVPFGRGIFSSNLGLCTKHRIWRSMNKKRRGGYGVDWSFRLIDFGRSRPSEDLLSASSYRQISDEWEKLMRWWDVVGDVGISFVRFPWETVKMPIDKLNSSVHVLHCSLMDEPQPEEKQCNLTVDDEHKQPSVTSRA
jgi:hypothetical protein